MGDAIPGRTGPGLFPEQPRGSFPQFRVGAQLSGRIGNHFRHRVQRPLRSDGELPDLVEPIAPEVEPHRVIRLCGEEVDDAAANGEFPTGLHPVGARISEFDQQWGDGREIELVSRCDAKRLHRRGAETLDRRPHRGDDDHRGITAETVPRLSPAGHRQRVGRDVLERQRLPSGGKDHVLGEQAEIVDQLLGVVLPRDDHQQRLSDTQKQPGEGESASGSGHGPGGVQVG